MPFKKELHVIQFTGFTLRDPNHYLYIMLKTLF